MSEPDPSAPETSFGGSLPRASSGRSAPRWTIPFLRALERCGDARASAEDAGIDHTTAYARRRAHAEFAADWEAALEAHKVAVRAREAEELAILRSAPRPAPLPQGERELIGAGSQLRRAGHDRWGPRKEKRFFDELAATANVTRAAAAAGVSTNAVHARRLRNPHFRAKWAAVLEVGKAEIDMHLVETAKRSFDPGKELDLGEVRPKVTVAEAIRITQGGPKKQEALDPNPFGQQDSQVPEDELAEVRERVLRKLERLRKRKIPGWIEAGWSYDEERDQIIPPGWVRIEGSPE